MSGPRLLFPLLGALWLPLAMGAEVDVYGAIKISVDSIDDGTERNVGVSSNLSYVGVKGGHRVNDRLTAIFKVEMGFDATGESSTLSPRWRYVGAKGEYGMVRLGNLPTPFRVLGKNFDEFPETIGEDRGVLGLGANGAPEYDLWSSNTITYTSPSRSGFQLDATYSSAYTGESTTAGSDDNSTAMAGVIGSYKTGDLNLRLAYERHEDDDSEGLRAIAKYGFDHTRVGLVYETIDAGAGSPLTRDAYGVNGAYTIDDLTYKAQMLIADDYDGKPDSGATNFSLGISKQVDKSISVYAMYGTTRNEKNARYSMGAAGHNGDWIKPAAGDDVKAISIGGVYLFE